MSPRPDPPDVEGPPTGGAPASLPVFDRERGVSRYDARDGVSSVYRLACPDPGCARDALYGWTAGEAALRFACPHCGGPFTAYLGEVRTHGTSRQGAVIRHALATVDPAGGRRFTFDEPAGEGASGPFSTTPGDPVILLHDAEERLRAVHDLATGGYLWLPAPPASPGAVLRRILRRLPRLARP